MADIRTFTVQPSVEELAAAQICVTVFYKLSA